MKLKPEEIRFWEQIIFSFISGRGGRWTDSWRKNLDDSVNIADHAVELRRKRMENLELPNTGPYRKEG